MFYKLDKAGTVVDIKNDGKEHIDAVYASVTAPQLTFVEIIVDGETFDGVWVAPGSSHSWWTNAGGKLLPPNGVKPGGHLKITASGACAVRIDWL